MSWWLTTGANNFPAEYQKAVAEMNGQAVAYLIRHLEWHPPTIRMLINKICDPFFKRNILDEEQPDYRARAAETLGKMGDRAMQAIPALRINAARIGTNQSDLYVQSAAIGALLLLKADSPDALIDHILDSKNTNWIPYATATLYVNTSMAESVPRLAEAYKSLTDESIKGRIATPLRFIRSNPELSVPVLTELLTHNDPSVQFNAAIGLSNFGPAATSAIPTLTDLLLHTNKHTREAAKIALDRINPGPAPNSGD